MYLLFVALGMVVAYFLIYGLLNLFCQRPFRFPKIFPLIYIVGLSIVATFLSLAIPDRELSNRFEHGLAGAFVAFFVCFLVVQTNRLPFNKFQFWLLAALLVTALGVTNEIAEFIGQEYFGLFFANSIADTWRDLASNTIGLLAASLIFTPMIKRPQDNTTKN